MKNIEIITKSLLSTIWAVDVLLEKYSYDNDYITKIREELENDRVLLVAYVAEKEQENELNRVVSKRTDDPYSTVEKLKEFDTSPFPINSENPNAIKEMIADKETIVCLLKSVDSCFSNAKIILESN